MKRSAKILIFFIAALAILFCSIAIGTRGRRAEAMFGGAVLIRNETAEVYAN